MLSLLFVSIAAGCGGPPDGPPRYALSGTVTREGQPMREGTIQFAPVGGGPAAQCPIIEGKYQFTDVNGPVQGEQVVKIARVLQKDVPPGESPKNVDPTPETGFQSPMPPGGWILKTSVVEGQNVSEPVDFNVDEAENNGAGRGTRRMR